MKLGISVWSCPPEWSLEQIFAFAAKTGYDGVELPLDEAGTEFGLDCTREQAENIKKLADKYNIQLYSVACGLHWKYSLTANDPAMREKAKNIVRKELETASWLGCDTILVVPGAVAAYDIPEAGEDWELVPYDVCYDRAVEWVEELKADAEKFGVCIGIENVSNMFLLSPLEMRDFIDRFDSPYVAAYFDVGNVVYIGQPEDWIRILNKRIKKVHIKDCDRATNWGRTMLSGDVDYPKVMQALREIGYDGWLTAEVGMYPSSPEQSIIDTYNAMKRILTF